jgi:DNA-nicking Smr family endonuclease
LSESLLAPGPLIDAQPGDELLYRRPGVPLVVFRRLRRGDYRVEAELDLHGMTGSQSATQLAEFLRYALGRGLVCVRIIHGKGLRSGNRGPVLKNTVNTLLRRAEAVLAFASARPAAGGTGATLVLLQRPRPPSG